MRKGLWAAVLTGLSAAGLARAQAPAVAPEQPFSTGPAGATVPLESACATADVDGRWAPCADGGGQLYGGAEYLLWWIHGYSVPALVSVETPPSLTAVGQRGNVVTTTTTQTQSSTTKSVPASAVAVLVGNDRLNGNDPYSGGRFTLGAWLDDCRQCGLEATFLFLGQRSQDFVISSAAFPGLALGRPLIRADTGGDYLELTALPGESVGAIAIRSETQLWGTEVNLRTVLDRGCGYHVDLIGGFRYLDLHESLNITEASTETAVAAPGGYTSTLGGAATASGGTSFLVADRFATRNQFYGGQVGASGEFFLADRLSLGGSAKVGLGWTHEVVEAAGVTTRTSPDGTVLQSQGGLLAVSSNSGRTTRDRFAVLPELTVGLGYWITPSLRASVGYNFLYWSDVVRPGDQIDTTVDLSRVPSFSAHYYPTVVPVRPAPLFRESDFWAQGINVGLEFSW